MTRGMQFPATHRNPSCTHRNPSQSIAHPSHTHRTPIMHPARHPFTHASTQFWTFFILTTHHSREIQDNNTPNNCTFIIIENWLMYWGMTHVLRHGSCIYVAVSPATIASVPRPIAHPSIHHMNLHFNTGAFILSYFFILQTLQTREIPNK